MNIDSLYRIFFLYFRTKRMQAFQQKFGLTDQTCILDVGGSEFNWRLLSTMPKVTILNISLPTERNPQFNYLVADGCHLPFWDNAFEIVYSNSVIEHLFNSDSQRLFADECRRVGQRYYIQTPNYHFIIEPHWLAPGFHWLPRWLQRRLARNFTGRGLITRLSTAECETLLDEIHLLDEDEVRCLFPDAEIWRERTIGMIKSLIAARQ